MPTKIRILIAAAALLTLAAPAGAVAGERAPSPRVLLSDFGPSERPSDALVKALLVHEEHRVGPEARLRGQSLDELRVVTMLEAARHLDAQNGR